MSVKLMRRAKAAGVVKWAANQDDDVHAVRTQPVRRDCGRVTT